MNENGYTENDYELALIELFQSLEGKQYRYEYGPDISRDYTNPILDDGFDPASEDDMPRSGGQVFDLFSKVRK